MQRTPSGGEKQSTQPGKGKRIAGLKSWHVCLLVVVAASPILFLLGVAFLGFCAGLAVPYFKDNLSNAQQTKARQDIEVIRCAIALHDAQNRPIQGTSLAPIIGRYLQDLPSDPWGNPYLLDANVGLIVSYGADAVAGGERVDSDQFAYYKPPVRLERVQYEGAWGVPKSGHKFILTFSKAFELVDEQALFKSLTLLTGNGNNVSLAELNKNHGHLWKLAKESNPLGGKLLLLNAAQGTSHPIDPKMSMNLLDGKNKVESDDTLLRFGVREIPLKEGPLDENIYSKDVRTYLRKPEPSGVKLERY